MIKKFCNYCRFYRNEEDIVFEWRGTGNRRIKKLICKHCKESRDSRSSLKEREAFGKEITRRNKYLQSHRMRGNEFGRKD